MLNISATGATNAAIARPSRVKKTADTLSPPVARWEARMAAAHGKEHR
jgi:hypothetical protein